MIKLKDHTGNNKIFLAAFIFMIVLAIFLRVYNFRDWLVFESDQVRDTALVEKVIDKNSSWPLLGPTMKKSENSRGEIFHLGPIHYYFQIVSAKIFGSDPQGMAYPDLFFSILIIPLLYLFLKKYFSSNLSLILSGIYAFSFYAIKYSRFALNPNPIPFFVILFLLSLYEFLIKKEKAGWLWIAVLGISLGVGVQLHAILIAVLPMTAFFVFAHLLKSKPETWKRICLVLLIALFINSGQIASEVKTNFSNSKILLASAFENRETNSFHKIADNANCHIQANFHILTSLGEDYCNTLRNIKKNNGYQTGFYIFGLLFSAFGYGALIYYFRREKGEKRYFLGLIALFISLSFIAMIPVFSRGFDEFKYFMHVSFIPVLFMGFLFVYFKKYQKIFIFPVVLFILFVIASNFYSVAFSANKLKNGTGIDYGMTTLGTIEAMADYLFSTTNNPDVIYVLGEGRTSFLGFYPSLEYIVGRRKCVLIRGLDISEITSGTPLFYVTNNKKHISSGKIENREIENWENFGNVFFYKLKN